MGLERDKIRAEKLKKDVAQLREKLAALEEKKAGVLAQLEADKAEIERLKAISPYDRYYKEFCKENGLEYDENEYIPAGSNDDEFVGGGGGGSYDDDDYDYERSRHERIEAEEEERRKQDWEDFMNDEW